MQNVFYIKRKLQQQYLEAPTQKKKTETQGLVRFTQKGFQGNPSAIDKSKHFDNQNHVFHKHGNS